MAFIRTKKLRGETYYALVENKRDGAKIRQTVIASLGRSPDPLARIDYYLDLARMTSPNSRTERRFKESWLRGWTRRVGKQRRLDGDYINPYTGQRRPFPDPTPKVLAQCEKAWREELAATQAKRAEFIRIAREIENFAKGEMDEAVWTAKRDQYLQARKAERDEFLAQFLGKRP
ncbi:MAG: hypothetical protein WCA27_30075 [Candidatus Sulfotelmatobacter sp.]